jgi:hypothetical protein
MQSLAIGHVATQPQVVSSLPVRASGQGISAALELHILRNFKNPTDPRLLVPYSLTG